MLKLIPGCIVQEGSFFDSSYETVLSCPNEAISKGLHLNFTFKFIIDNMEFKVDPKTMFTPESLIN